MNEKTKIDIFLLVLYLLCAIGLVMSVIDENIPFMVISLFAFIFTSTLDNKLEIQMLKDELKYLTKK